MKSNSARKPMSTVVATTTSLWTPDDRTFALIPQFNPNPETGSLMVSVLLYQCDDEMRPHLDKVRITLDYDFQNEKIGRYWSSCNCDCLLAPLKQALAQTKDYYVDWYQNAKDLAQKQLREGILPHDILDGGMIAYHDLIPGREISGFERSVFPAGLLIAHANRRWWVTDYYCAKQDCSCNKALLTFNDLDRTEKMTDALCLNYASDEDYSIREFDKQQLSETEVKELVKVWFERKPYWFNNAEMRSRKKQLKLAVTRTIRQKKKPGILHETFLTSPTEKARRNDPCPCGSGKKYKQCCLK